MFFTCFLTFLLHVFVICVFGKLIAASRTTNHIRVKRDPKITDAGVYDFRIGSDRHTDWTAPSQDWPLFSLILAASLARSSFSRAISASASARSVCMRTCIASVPKRHNQRPTRLSKPIFSTYNEISRKILRNSSNSTHSLFEYDTSKRLDAKSSSYQWVSRGYERPRLLCYPALMMELC